MPLVRNQTLEKVHCHSAGWGKLAKSVPRSRFKKRKVSHVLLFRICFSNPLERLTCFGSLLKILERT